jgi:BirA family biotin operon repressor/biotin-[acetyl-CoA-carboxylase] ligase
MNKECTIVTYESTTSTNDAVFEQAKAAVQAEGLGALNRPFVAISAAQTSGRGRLGRNWSSPPGGLYLSILLDGSSLGSEDGARRLATLSPLTALAVCDALQPFTTEPVRIKWPNDVITSKGKLAGILVELKSLGKALPTCVVFGIGVNVARPELDVFSTAAYLDDAPAQYHGEKAGDRIELDTVAASVIQSFLDAIKRWQNEDRSFAPFAERYQEHVSQLGDEVAVWDATGKEIAAGTVTGIDSEGRLLILSDGREIAVYAGEVTFRQPSTEQQE